MTASLSSATPTRPTRTMTASERDAFERDGFLVVPGALSADGHVVEEHASAGFAEDADDIHWSGV